MSAVAMVPSKDKTVFIAGDGDQKKLKGVEETLEFLESELAEGTDVLLGVMGGPAQNLFIRARQFGIGVHRIPWFKLYESTGITAGADTEERAEALRKAWVTSPEAFYPLEELDGTIWLVRELTRVRLGIQDKYRKPAQLQYQAAFRDMEPLLPEGRTFVNLRTTMANPRFIEGALADEHEFELRIKELTRNLPIWEALHPGDEGVLPAVKGLGPSLGGSLIGEIGDIRRFATPEALRAYARFHVNGNGNFPRRAKGKVSSWNRYLNRAVWLWSTDQMARYDHVWRHLYDWKKAKECQEHPELVSRVVVKDGEKRRVSDFTLGHIDKRAKRWVGSKLLEYVWELWHAIERGESPEQWYAGSHWQALFTNVERELDDGLREFLYGEIERRKKVVPE